MGSRKWGDSDPYKAYLGDVNVLKWYEGEAPSSYQDLGKAGVLANTQYATVAAPDPGEGWADLYKTYDKWKQEDAHWYNTTIGVGDVSYPRKMADARAQMAAGGMKRGTQQWNQNIQSILNERADIETRYQEKKDVLENSSLGTSLRVKYDELKNREELTARTVVYDELVGEKEYKVNGTQVYMLRKRHVSEYQENKTGRLLYGTGSEQAVTPTFDEFWEGQVGGATDVTNPYEPEAPADETLEQSNARQAASGRAF